MKRRILLSLALAGLLIAWTWALLMPIAPEVAGGIGVDLSFLIGKSLHIGVYAVLAALTMLLPLSAALRGLLIGCLIAHGGATEYLQQFVQRGSSWRDFGLDTLGVILGSGSILMWWHFFRPNTQQNLQDQPGGEDRQTTDLR